MTSLIKSILQYAKLLFAVLDLSIKLFALLLGVFEFLVGPQAVVTVVLWWKRPGCWVFRSTGLTRLLSFQLVDSIRELLPDFDDVGICQILLVHNSGSLVLSGFFLLIHEPRLQFTDPGRLNMTFGTIAVLRRLLNFSSVSLVLKFLLFLLGVGIRLRFSHGDCVFCILLKSVSSAILTLELQVRTSILESFIIARSWFLSNPSTTAFDSSVISLRSVCSLLESVTNDERTGPGGYDTYPLACSLSDQGELLVAPGNCQVWLQSSCVTIRIGDILSWIW